MSMQQPYPSNISDSEGECVLPSLCLLPEDTGPRVHHLRAIFDGLRWLVRSGAPWHSRPKDFPPWELVSQQTRRGRAAGCFEALVHDLRAVLRFAAGRESEPTAAVLDSRTIPSSRESGGRAGPDGSKRRHGSKGHAAVDTLGHLRARPVTPANEQDRADVGILVEAVPHVSGESVELASVDQGDTGADPTAVAARHGIKLEVVKRPEAKRGVVLLPRRWVVERTFGWAARFRRLARDSEWLSETLAGLALRGVQLSDAPEGRSAVRVEFITRSELD
jgi:transposase